METRVGRLRGTRLGQPWEGGQGHGPPEHGSPSLSPRTTHREGSGEPSLATGAASLAPHSCPACGGRGGHGTPLSVFLPPGLLT